MERAEPSDQRLLQVLRGAGVQSASLRLKQSISARVHKEGVFQLKVQVEFEQEGHLYKADLSKEHFF